jgi:hypothetical protein
MRSMAIDRRVFLAQLGALAFVRPAAAASSATFLAARGKGAGFVISRFDASGRIDYDIDMQGRGHGFALSSDGRLAVAVARRPGRSLLVFDTATGGVRQKVKAAAGFVFCGHAVFGHGDRLLYTTEAQEEDGPGHVGVFDARNRFRRVAAWPTYGDDPHELLLVDDALVVANGGFGPDGAGANIDPSLVRLDARDGRLLAQEKPPAELRQVSLRHLAVAGRSVFVAGQYAGPSRDRPPLVARWDGAALAFLDLPGPDLDGLANYCGSIAASAAGTRLCVASPHGGTVVVFDLEGRVTQRLAIPDVCGVAPLEAGFVLTGGRGDVATTPAGTAIAVEGARWDNHITAIAARQGQSG